MIQIDMEMPATCYDCPFCHDCCSCCLVENSEFDFEICDEQRMPYCPLKEVPDNGGWVSVKDAMPPERETIFAKFKGTDQWNHAMFATSSEDVRVVVQFEDGTRSVWHDNTMDGKWKCEREKCAYPKRTVTHWMPNPELPKENKEQ